MTPRKSHPKGFFWCLLCKSHCRAVPTLSEIPHMILWC